MDALTFNFNPRPLTVLDLCCGAGLASLGLESAGLEIVAGVDVDAVALGAWRQNLSAPCHCKDVADIPHAVLPMAVDVVITGPPCQDDSRLGRMHKDKGRGSVKAPALALALAQRPTWVIMEVTLPGHLPWCHEQGARQTFKLVDHEQGGHTLRKRWFAVWGPADLQVPEVPEDRRTGWGAALGQEGRLCSESINLSDRRRLAREPEQPCHAVLGHGTSHVLYTPDGGRERMTTAQEAALQGFPGLSMDGMNRYQRQTAVGNGWTRSFGYSIGKAIKGATA